MSATTSPATGRTYGVERVCSTWGVARSSHYSRQAAANEDTRPAPAKRGPKSKISDEELLAAIKDDLSTSPFIGEGHRKVWARLRIRSGIRVAATRVLRLMRQNKLLSPHRGRQAPPNPHDGKIISDAPNVMWGTDGARVLTVDDGWVWTFFAVEHWNAECVGWHACKKGDRYAALQPISMALAAHYGSTGADVARGLALRMDHGSQYLSEHFTNQIKFWGINPSYAFIEQPQTNGVAERFNRTFKEQVIHGRTYQNLAELRLAVQEFVDRYNSQWLIEKMGYMTPNQARRAWFGEQMPRAA